MMKRNLKLKWQKRWNEYWDEKCLYGVFDMRVARVGSRCAAGIYVGREQIARIDFESGTRIQKAKSWCVSEARRIAREMAELAETGISA